MKQSTDTFRCISLDILKTYSLKAARASYTNSEDFKWKKEKIGTKLTMKSKTKWAS